MVLWRVNVQRDITTVSELINMTHIPLLHNKDDYELSKATRFLHPCLQAALRDLINTNICWINDSDYRNKSPFFLYQNVRGKVHQITFHAYLVYVTFSYSW